MKLERGMLRSDNKIFFFLLFWVLFIFVPLVHQNNFSTYILLAKSFNISKKLLLQEYKTYFMINLFSDLTLIYS